MVLSCQFPSRYRRRSRGCILSRQAIQEHFGIRADLQAEILVTGVVHETNDLRECLLLLQSKTVHPRVVIHCVDLAICHSEATEVDPTSNLVGKNI